MENKRLVRIQNYILFFFVFAFLGWILETIFALVVLGHFTKRGFLYGPLCPIYGYGALILIIFLNRYKSKPIKTFVYSAIIFSIFEYVVSYILEALFNMHFWDYTYDFMNLNGRIAIFYSLSWGFIALIFTNIIYPLLKKLFDKILLKIPDKICKIVFISIFAIYGIDTILSCVRYLN